VAPLLPSLNGRVKHFHSHILMGVPSEEIPTRYTASMLSRNDSCPAEFVRLKWQINTLQNECRDGNGWNDSWRQRCLSI